VQCIDLTTLAGDDTETNVNRLCFKAALPIREDIITSLGVQECQIGVGAVCVYSARVREACASPSHVTPDFIPSALEHVCKGACLMPVMIVAETDQSK
jgi:deoxyribose-phosphate aldolase